MCRDKYIIVCMLHSFFYVWRPETVGTIASKIIETVSQMDCRPIPILMIASKIFKIVIQRNWRPVALLSISYKIVDTTMQMNWRPVTILTILSKILEIVIKRHWKPVTILTVASKIVDIVIHRDWRPVTMLLCDLYFYTFQISSEGLTINNVALSFLILITITYVKTIGNTIVHCFYFQLSSI